MTAPTPPHLRDANTGGASHASGYADASAVVSWTPPRGVLFFATFFWTSKRKLILNMDSLKPFLRGKKGLKHVGKVRAELFETPRADKHNQRRESPKVRRKAGVLPKPLVVYETLSIALDQVIRGIELQKELKLFGHHLQVPENRRPPKAELQNHRHELPDVAQKDRQRRGQPTKPQRQTNHRK